MPKNESKITKFVERNIITIILAGLSTVTAIANLWSVSKLAPVTQDLAVITTRVDAVEIQQLQCVPRTEIEATHRSIENSVAQWKTDTNNRLERIENKIDRLN